MNDNIMLWNEGSLGFAEISNHQMNLRGNFQLELLKRPHPCFLPMEEISLTEDSLLETYMVNNKPNLLNLKLLTKLEKQLLLIHVGELFLGQNRAFVTTFNPENIYYTYEYEVFFGFRTLKEMCTDDIDVREFTEYQALILSILQDKYSYEQLIDTGIDVLEKQETLTPFIEAQTSEELYQILSESYEANYKKSKASVIGFPIKNVKIAIIIVSVVFFVLTGALIYFANKSFTVTDQYQVRMNIYQAHYNKDPSRVVTLSEKLTDDELDETLKIVVADSLISSNKKENLVRAFYLDPSRQVECIEQLVELEELDSIAGLRSDKNKVKLYQAFYAKDYNKAISLAENNLDLKYDAQAQILLSRAYMAVRNYTAAIDLVEKLGDEELQLEVYKTYRDDVKANETNPKQRQQVLEVLDSMIAILENQNSVNTTNNVEGGTLL